MCSNAGPIHDYCKPNGAFASALSASSAVAETCLSGHGPTNSRRQLSSETSSGGPGCGFGGPSSRTLLTVLTVSANVVRILMTLVPARPSRPKATSIPRARRKVCARRRRPASARIFGPGGHRNTVIAATGGGLQKVGGAACPRVAIVISSRTQAGPCDWPHRRARMRVGPAPLPAQPPGTRAMLQTRFCPRRERLAHRVRFTRDHT